MGTTKAEKIKDRKKKIVGEDKILNREATEILTDIVTLVKTDDECWGIDKMIFGERVTGENNKCKDPGTRIFQLLFRDVKEASVARAQ